MLLLTNTSSLSLSQSLTASFEYSSNSFTLNKLIFVSNLFLSSLGISYSLSKIEIRLSLFLFSLLYFIEALNFKSILEISAIDIES